MRLRGRVDGGVGSRVFAGDAWVGRRGELSVLGAAYEGADGGVAGLVRIEGPAGIGKSALVARALSAMADPLVLRSQGDESEQDLPYGVVDQLVAGLPPAGRDARPLLAVGREVHADPIAVGADLLGALGVVSADRTVVLVVDDVQWVDDPSAAALMFVLRRLDRDPVLVLMCARREATGRVDGWWERLDVRGRDAVRLPLAGLDARELSDLAAELGRPLTATGAAEQLWEHTWGHPLYARALLEDLPAEALAAAGVVLPAPRSFAAVVLVRLSRLSPAAQALVVAVSVLGVACPLPLAGAVAELDDPVAALDEAVRAGLLEERAATPTRLVGFGHPLLRSAVYGDLAPAHRRARHRAAARVVSGPASIAHRVAASAGADPDLASELEAYAADGAGGPAVAADQLRWAAELSGSVADRERRLALAVETLLAGGEVARAVAMEEAVAACPPGARRSQVLGQLALLTGRLTTARAELEAAASSAGATDTDVRATALAHLALLEVVAGRPSRAIDVAPVALTAGTDRAVRLPAGFALVLGLAAVGRRAEAHAVLEHAGGPADAPTPLHADALVVRGVLAALADDDSAARAALTDARRRARAGEPVRALALALGFLAVVLHRLGEVEEATTCAELAVSMSRDGGTALAGAVAHAFAAQLAAARGRGDEARGHLAAATRAARPWWGGALALGVSGALVARASDDPRGMLSALEPALAPEVRELADGLGLLAVRALEIEALLGLGRLGDAADALDALDARLHPSATGRYPLEAARLRARLLEQSGDPARAQALAGAALARSAATTAPLEVGLMETDQGRRLVAGGDRRGGLELLRAARVRLHAAGAGPFVARVDVLLHEAGLTPSPTEEALGLTPHEEAVSTLVARGLTNREVGERLFVTPRTVAYHLSNVYAKLGVSSRRELRDLVAVGTTGSSPVRT